MKFRKELKIVIEGEIFDNQDPVEIFKNLKFSWKHWWQSNHNWPYGIPSENIQKGRIDKIFVDDKEIENDI